MKPPALPLPHHIAEEDEAALPEDYATPHGLRAGFLTQAAFDGAPLAAAMQLSLHRSVIQAQKYYADVEIEENPATELLERSRQPSVRVQTVVY